MNYLIENPIALVVMYIAFMPGAYVCIKVGASKILGAEDFFSNCFLTALWPLMVGISAIMGGAYPLWRYCLKPIIQGLDKIAAKVEDEIK